MNDKPVTLVVSDLHLGGGPDDKGDDHIYDHLQFTCFIQEQSNTPEGKNGNIELIINGDFLEFAQVRPEIFTLLFAEYWCSEVESMQKLEAILNGHPQIFDALKEFQKPGNMVTLAAGNHDVDLYWPEVQTRIKQAAGPVNFELGRTWYSRYDNRLVISHGHMFDPANKFVHWDNPILETPFKSSRLEMCPGTLFMVKIVNFLEHDYPFADNIKPITSLRKILWRCDKPGFGVVSWMLTQFVAMYPGPALNQKASMDYGKKLVQKIAFNDAFANKITLLYQKAINSEATIDIIREELNSEDAVFDFLYQLLATMTKDEWMPVFDTLHTTVLGRSGGTTLEIGKAGILKEKEQLRKKAKKKLLSNDNHQIVIFGHTHQPDKQEYEVGWYFNTGSWTRYAEYKTIDTLDLDDLRQEDNFPYKLNYVRIEMQPKNLLKANMHCYKTEKDYE